MPQLTIETDVLTFARLESLTLQLKQCTAAQGRLAVLDQDPVVSTFLSRRSFLNTCIAGLSSEGSLVMKSLVAIEQAERVTEGFDALTLEEGLRSLIAQLLPVERFYSEVGGIVGYQSIMLRFLLKADIFQEPHLYHRPQGLDLTQETEEVRKSVLEGILSLPLMAEIYPIGGAADRLRLCDPITKVALPAAKLPFFGKTLLEGLIIDLQAREYLHYKLFSRQVTVPVAMMTSQEKDNHSQILSVCQELNWFNRSSSSFAFFSQSGVPVMDTSGNWCILAPCKLLLKPGGHGVMWKMAKDQGVFDWLTRLNRKKLLVRQINNPIAGCDHGLLALTGIGCSQNKVFGFASCPRQVKSAEGVNVLIEKRKGYCLTNIEYCDFAECGIEDVPVEQESSYSLFPSNTNILFADIENVLRVIEDHPIPGLIVNVKKTSYQDEKGEMQERAIARLESTMQNIADYFVGKSAPAFLTYNERRKTISTTKREFQLGSSLLETPEGCYLDFLHNAHELLSKYCHFSMPPFFESEKGPSFHFTYHPALGPLYGVIAQKLRGGRIKEGSECQLNISEIDVEKLGVEGSLRIQAENIMGHCDEAGVLIYSERVGRCILKNVIVRNKGVNHDVCNLFWKNEIARLESCEIILQGTSEFIAENVILEGNMRIEVPSGFRMIARMNKGQVEFVQELLDSRRSCWKYSVGEDFSIHLGY